MLYAVQISPEYQESPLYAFKELWPDNIAVCGNCDFIDHKCEVFSRVQEVLDAGELADILADFAMHGFNEWYNNVTEAIMDILPPENKTKYNTRDIHELRLLIDSYDGEEKTLCDVLSIVTGKKWDYRIIRGCCQGDWNYIYYQIDEWNENALDAFECEYFNTGSEWVIHDGEDAPEGPEDVSGFSVYCHAWREADIVKELADASGEPIEGAVLWAWNGYRKIDTYKRMEA